MMRRTLASSAPRKRGERAEILGYALLLSGAVGRVMVYLRDYPLWLDEAKLALNVLERSGADLLAPLAYDQVAPWGFLLTVKGVTAVLGADELILRAVPLMSGIAALCLFACLVRQVLSQRGAGFAIAVFALVSPLLVQSSNLKPYSSDVAIAVLLLWLTTTRTISNPAVRFTGLIVPWISFPSVFVLGGSALSDGIEALRSRHLTRACSVAATSVIWLIGFVVYWWIALRPNLRNEFLRDYWSEAFAPAGIEIADWLVEAFLGTVTNTGGVTVPVLGAAVVVWGFGSLGRRRPKLAGTILATVALAVGASAFELYPFTGRTNLYLAPMIILALGAGMDDLIRRSIPRGSSMGVAVAAVVMAPMLVSGLATVWSPPGFRDVRGLAATIKERHKKGDSVYVHHLAAKSFRYYAMRLEFESEFIELGPGSLPDRLDGNRTWLVTAAEWAGSPEAKAAAFGNWLDARSPADDTITLTGARAYLWKHESLPRDGNGKGRGGEVRDPVMTAMGKVEMKSDRLHREPARGLPGVGQPALRGRLAPGGPDRLGRYPRPGRVRGGGLTAGRLRRP